MTLPDGLGIMLWILGPVAFAALAIWWLDRRE